MGRVSILAGDRPLVFPVNFAIAYRTIVFRTGPGTKLEHGPGTTSCFEVDGYDSRSHEGWSVMAFGRLEEITNGLDPLSRSLRQLPVEPMAPGRRMHWIAMRVEEVSGRHFTGGWSAPREISSDAH